MRRASLLCAVMTVLAVAPPALAQGGPAACVGAFEVRQPQTVGGLSLEPGAYEITVQESGDLTCDQAREEFRGILSSPDATLPDGWQVDSASRTFERDDGSDAFSVMEIAGAAAGEGGGGLSWD